MEEIVLQAETRKVIGKQVRALRRAGKLPAVIYGHNMDSVPISLEQHQANIILPTVSSSHLIKVAVEDDQEYTVLVRDKQRHPITSVLIHVDFQSVSLTEKLRAMVSIELTGTAPAVKNFNGVLVTGQEQIEVECLPGDLLERIEVNLEQLHEIGDAVYVRELQIPETIEVLTDLDEMIVLITAPTAEPVVEEEEVEEVEEGEPEVIEKGKKEEEDY